ncbi:MAG: Hpt domain-containing protein [Rhizobiaceae bacterium]|nr:Hpt domain-containing protein [Rhizobiaceae bacterium]MCV0407391.1 Hpt domain-containing protein [Rhizobiaceae bacterium]
MALQNIEAVAFSRPGGESAGSARRRPIDLDHLANQTFGDRALEAEVLGLFMQQAASVRKRIGAADEAERRQLAHGLKGAAAGVGAFAISECASALENDPASGRLVKRLGDLIDETRCFIASICR